MKMKRTPMLAAAILVLSPASHALAGADVWDGNGASPPNGVWGTDANWADNTTPGNADTATFNIANSYNVTFNAAPAAIQALTTSAGNVTFTSSGGAQTLAVNSASGGQDVTVNGGATLSLGTSGNPVHLTAGDDLVVNGNGTLNVNFGSDVSTLDLLLGTGGLAGGTIVVDGSGSSLNRTGTTNNIMGVVNGTVGLTYRNGATGDINGQFTVVFAGPGAISASLNVESDADLQLDSLVLGGGGGTGPTGTATVTGAGSTIVQTGASTLTVGRPTAGQNVGILNVNSGGTFTTGTGAIALNTTGTLSVAGGTLNANGALTMSAGSTLTLNGGTLNANAGLNNAAGGTLNFFNGELVVNGGTFVPNSGAAFAIVGQSMSDLPHLHLTNNAQLTVSGANLAVGASQKGKLTIEGGADCNLTGVSFALIANSGGS